MKLLGLHRLAWNIALGKGLAMLFAVQLVASAFCVVTPALASETSSETQAHCHAESMQMSPMMDHSMGTSSMPDMSELACVHCDVPTTFLKVSNSLDHLQNTQLLAVIAMPLSMAVAYDTQPLLMVRNHAPPRSSTLLFHTTSRILI